MSNVKKPALGKGLSALIPLSEEAAAASVISGEPIYNSQSLSSISELPVGKIEPNPYQPRITFEKEALEENRHFVEINNKETLAQVFTDLRYTKKDNEAMSAGLMEALRHQGFI